MRYLLTNDDGIYARGLSALYEELSQDADCLIVAPEVEQSAVGHAITISRPLMVRRAGKNGLFRGYAVAGTPAAHYFAEPVRGSVHSFGMAVDVTLADAAGREFDMGSGFDAMTPASHPALEAEQLAAGAITRAHIAARERLRGAMAAGGFRGIATEWWHFDHGDRDAVRRDLPRVL